VLSGNQEFLSFPSRNNRRQFGNSFGYAPVRFIAYHIFQLIPQRRRVDIVLEILSRIYRTGRRTIAKARKGSATIFSI
jgi:hypothetical protein